MLISLLFTISQATDGRDSPSNSPSIGNAPIEDGEKRRQETALDGAIVESIPGNALSAEDSDPQVTIFLILKVTRNLIQNDIILSKMINSINIL